MTSEKLKDYTMQLPPGAGKSEQPDSVPRSECELRKSLSVWPEPCTGR